METQVRKAPPFELHKHCYRKSNFDALTQAQQAEVVDWFLVDKKLSYRRARQRIQDKFGVKVGVTNTGTFWHRNVAPILAGASGQSGPMIKPASRHYFFDALTEAQCNQIVQWFISEPDLTYAVAARRIKERFGLLVKTWKMNSFYHRHCLPVILQQPEREPRSFQLTLTIQPDRTVTGSRQCLPPAIPPPGQFLQLVLKVLPDGTIAGTSELGSIPKAFSHRKPRNLQGGARC